MQITTEYQYKNSEKTRSSSSSSSIRSDSDDAMQTDIHITPREEPESYADFMKRNADVISDLMIAWGDETGLHAGGAIRRDIIYYLKMGLEPGVIAAAIEDTGLAPRPSWYYTRAILQRVIADGVRTVEQYDERAMKRAEMPRFQDAQHYRNDRKGGGW